MTGLLIGWCPPVSFFVTLNARSTISPYFGNVAPAGNTTAAGSLEEGCQACTRGYYCRDTGTTLATRTVCPLGHYCLHGSNSATPCASGSYNDETGSWTADACKSKCDRKNKAQEGKCGPNNLVCLHLAFTTSCAAGEDLLHTERHGMDLICNIVTIRFDEAFDNAALYSHSPPFLFVPFPASSSSRSVCQTGYFCPRGARSPINVCRIGHYCPEGTPGAATYPCPAGTYSGSPGLMVSSQCLDCPVGSYCPPGSTSPTDCPAGTYQTIERAPDATACQPCEPGYACEQTGMFEMTTL